MVAEVEWRPIKDYEGIYEVSNTGVVRSLDRVLVYENPRFKSLRMDNLKGKVLKQFPSGSRGYLKVILYNGGKIKNRYTHSLVAEAFIPRSNESLQVNHKDNNILNNHVSNLEWVTQHENIQHSVRQKRHTYGERNTQSKLKDSDILAIREMRSQGMLLKEIGDKFGICFGTVGQIVRGDSWKHLLGKQHDNPAAHTQAVEQASMWRNTK